MKTIKFSVTDRHLKPVIPNPIITWNVGYQFRFSFDDEWEHNKTLRIVNDKGWYTDKEFTGNVVEIDKVVDTDYVYIGVYTDTKSSTDFLVGCRKSIIDDSEQPNISEELRSELGNKADKATTLEGYGINDAYTKAEIDTKLTELSTMFEEEARCVVNAATHYDFPSIGSQDVIYKAETERLIYQWKPDELKYEVIGDTSDFENINVIYGGNANGND